MNYISDLRGAYLHNEIKNIVLICSKQHIPDN